MNERLDAQTVLNPETDCWVWTGNQTPKGYGMFSHEGKSAYVHRLSYERHKGPIPARYEIDHLCRNPSCLNPAHLEAVTHAENIRRAMRQKWWEVRRQREAEAA